jgi:membrane associated rhomboid family serine protease
VSRRGQRVPFDTSQLRITQGALILLFLEVGLSLVWLLGGRDPVMRSYLDPTPWSVWHEWKVWTLATGPFFEPEFVSMLFQGLILWMFVPQLERWWGTSRFLRFAAYTSLAGTVAGTLFGLLIEQNASVSGLDPFIYASIVSFGILYARQPVRFFGVLPMTGRQLMYGILGFVALFVVLTRAWASGAAFAAAIGVAVALTSERWNPRLAWLRWRARSARRHLDVLDGGKSKSGGKGKGPRWVN